MIIWITGLSGVGKTTLGSRVYEAFKAKHQNTIFLDGDILREVLGASGYTYEERYVQAEKIHNLCKMLDAQGMHVVCATMSLFHEIQRRNRETFTSYYEVYVKASMEELIRRDQKGIYSGALKGTVKNIVGFDVKYEEPLNPELIVDNNEFGGIEEKVSFILSGINE